MAYDWNDSGRAPEMPNGEHRVTIHNVVFGGKDGPFRAKDGSPKLMVAFRSAAGAEAVAFYTLSDKAAWTFVELLRACEPAFDMAKMTALGIHPSKFAEDEGFAKKNLIEKKRTLTIRVSREMTDYGKEVVVVKPIRAEFVSRGGSAAPASAASSSQSIPDDEIPF